MGEAIDSPEAQVGGAEGGLGEVGVGKSNIFNELSELCRVRAVVMMRSISIDIGAWFGMLALKFADLLGWLCPNRRAGVSVERA